jgi:hypothetical protein
MKITIETEDESEGKRLLFADDAMLEITSLVENIRSFLKHGKAGAEEITLDEVYDILRPIADKYWED